MKIAVVRVRGMTHVRRDIEKALDMLRLYNKNYCVVVEDTPANRGTLNKVKDYVTYGPILDEVFKEMVEKRGDEYTGKLHDEKKKIDYGRRFFEFNGKKYKKYFRLNPPRKGYRSIKKGFQAGGALGNRKDMINDLLRRMI